MLSTQTFFAMSENWEFLKETEHTLFKPYSSRIFSNEYEVGDPTKRISPDGDATYMVKIISEKNCIAWVRFHLNTGEISFRLD